MELTRREWLAAAGATVAGAMLPQAAQAESPAPKVCVFSKHLQFLDYPQLAAAVKAAGADGVDLTVRDGGHVLPENVEHDLPRAAAAMRAEGLEIAMISTRLMTGTEENAERILATMATEGIRFLRVGGHKYPKRGNPAETLAKVEEDCRRLARLCEKHGVYAGYHNHSGALYVGAPLWDLLRIFEAVGSPHLGSNFDIGHCMVEGPFGDWDITTRALAPHARMCAVKDFHFEGARPRWVELGKGIVPVTSFLEHLRNGGFTGPIGIHFEYDAYEKASESEKLAHVSAAVSSMREATQKVWA
jgi:L-ribulose-5-phosphate 3-epimerase